MKAKLLKRIRKECEKMKCQHDLMFIKNIFGDEIIWSGYKRSIWKCTKCGKNKWNDKLYYTNESLQN